MPDWLRITWLIVSVAWVTGALGLYARGLLNAWLWSGNHPDPIDPPEYETVHKGSNLVSGCVICFMWPFIIPMAIYEWLRYGRR